MKNNQTLWAASALVLLAFLYYFTQTGAVDTKKISRTALQFDRQEVATVQLSNTQGSLSFSRSDEGWTLENYPVDTLRMNRMLEDFATLEMDRLITENPEKHTRYELLETSTRFHAMTATETDVLDLLVGKRGANYQETFVREFSKDEVFAVKSSLSQYHQKTPKDFWDRSITSLDVNSINSLEMQGEMNYALSRKASNWQYNGEPVDFDKVMSMLRPLAALQASNFAEAIGPENSFYQKMVIGFENDLSLELSFYLKDEQGALLLVMVSENEKLFEFSKSGLTIFNKTIEDLLPEQVPES